MRDILNRADIVELIDKFYTEVLEDELIGVFFSEVAKMDKQVHMPIMYDFWEGILLGNTKYRGNAMLKHILLNKKKPLEGQHFERWLSLWEKNIRANFEGQNADEAIKRAQQIGGLIKHKVGQQNRFDV